MLAIFFGVATEEQSRQILRYIAEHSLDVDTPLRTCHPMYSLSQVFPWYILTGLSDYHRALIWPWLGTLNAVNKARLGHRDEAIADLTRIGEWHLRANVVGEVYARMG